VAKESDTIVASASASGSGGSGGASSGLVMEGQPHLSTVDRFSQQNEAIFSVSGFPI
jgi:hypothetical protein